MKVLLLTCYFPPDTGSAAHLFYELGKALVQRGHQVTVVTGMPGYHAAGPLERYDGRLWLREEMEGMRIARVAAPRFADHSMIGRALWQFSGAVTSLCAGLVLPHHEIAVVYSPPLPLGLSGYMLHGLRGVPFILCVHDLFPQSIIDLGLLSNAAAIRGFEWLERLVYRKAVLITVPSEGNRQHVIHKGAAPAKVVALPDWADTCFIQPGERMNVFRQQHGLDDKFVVSFAGILGYSQDLDVVLGAASLLQSYDNILFVIVGDGVEKPRLVARAAEIGLQNVRFLAMQPRDKYPAVLHASDVGLATLHSSVRTPTVPSKIQSIMAAARPVVAAMNLDGDAPRLIEKARCGYALRPEDPQLLAETLLELYQNPGRCRECGQNGRRYVERHLSLEVCVQRYETLFMQVLGRGQTTHA